MTLLEIANSAGVELPATADPATVISSAASLEDARPGQIAYFEHPKYLRALRATQASVVLVPQAFSEALSPTQLHVAKPAAAFGLILDQLAPPPAARLSGIHPSAVVDSSAEVDPSAYIHPLAVIEAGVKIGARTTVGSHATIGSGTTIGEDCTIYPNAVLGTGTVMGSRVIIHSGAVLGSDGFGFRFAGGKHIKAIHRGCVQVDDDVEIGACTTIDRARFGRTWIQTGTKIDNLVQIAHNVVIGPHCLIIAQTGISGSARLGKYVTLAGQVGVVGHVVVGDEVVVAAKSGVSKDIPPKQQLLGMFGIPIKEARELVAHYHRLPRTAAKIKTLENEVQELKKLVGELLRHRERTQHQH